MFRSGLIACSIVLVSAATVLAATRRPGAATYTRDHVFRAFAVQGFPLTDAWIKPANLTSEALLVPKTREPFWVYVGVGDDEARSYFKSVAGFALPPETFDMLRKNVIVSSDSGLSAAQRKRIRVAMQLLREPAEILEQLAECSKPQPISKQLNVSDYGMAAACLVQTGDRNCEWWEAASFRADGSVVSWTRGTTPDAGLCIDARQTGLSIYDPTGHVKVELAAADVVPSSARAVREPGGRAALYVGFTDKGAAKFCRLTRALAQPAHGFIGRRNSPSLLASLSTHDRWWTTGRPRTASAACLDLRSTACVSRWRDRLPNRSARVRPHFWSDQRCRSSLLISVGLCWPPSRPRTQPLFRLPLRVRRSGW